MSEEFREMKEEFIMSLESFIPKIVEGSDYFILDESNNAIPCTMKEWIIQRESLRKEDKRHVAYEKVKGKKVSTVWLGLNHNWLPGKPLLFETMVFDKKWNHIYCMRYSTWQEAEEGHKAAVQWVKDGCKYD